MAIRLLSNENIDGNLTINGTGTANAPTLAIDTTSSSQFNHAVEAFNGNLTNGENNVVLIGKEGSTKNTGYIAYKWFSSGSNSNILTFGHWASDNLMNLTGDGKLGIGTESPAEKLEVSGSIKSTSRAITGGSTPGITLSYDTSNSIGLIESWTSKPIGIETSGVRRITIQNNGYVGIGTGTNSVTNQLHVATATDDAYALRIQGSTNNAAGVWTGIGIGGELANTKTAIIFEDIGASYARGKLLFCINNEQNQNSASPSDAIMTISNDGYVGIGTTDPSSNLHSVITTAGDSALKLQDDTGSVFDFQCGISGVTGDALLIKDTTLSYNYLTLRGGKVGINEANPLTKLHVTDEVSTGINLYSTYNYSLNRNWRLMINGFGSGNWGGISLRQSTTNGGTPNTDVFGIDRAGNVGIGINASNTAVDAKLHIANVSKDSVALKIQNAGLATANGPVYGDYQELLFVSGSANSVPAGIRHMANVWQNSDSALGFYTNQHGGSYAERMRIDGDGYVGIGKTDPSKTLDVLGGGFRLQGNDSYSSITIGAAGWSQDYPYLRLDTFNSDGTGYFHAFGHRKTDGTKTVRMLISDTSSRYVTVIDQLNVATFTSNELGGSGNYPSFSTNVVLRHSGTSYINGGNVGIGVTTINSEKLYVVSTLQYGVRIDHAKNIGTSSTFEDALFLANTSSSNTNVCRIGMSTSGTDGQHHRVSLQAERDTSGNYRGEFSILMRQSDASHPKRLKLDYAGTLTVSGDVVAYGSPSDKRYKENIKPVTNALAKVSKLQGVTFDWKESESLLDIKEDIGFIAQDVQEVLPELVRENEDGKLSLRDKGIVPILVEAIKELKAEIEELKNNK